MSSSRSQQLQTLLRNLPAYRQTQINAALFDPKRTGWESVSVLPKTVRETLVKENVPWMALSSKAVLESRFGDTWKTVLETQDKKGIESVLMRNARGHFSICVSSQIGCAMNCSFCATGKMGFSRNLNADEIVDQYRFWMYFLHAKKEDARITNIVMMGMGEPLANYDAVKTFLNIILKHTDIGHTRIIVSTVGVLPSLQKLLRDPEWPPVRIAISLHSADPDIRKKIVPSTANAFFPQLLTWMQNDHQKNPQRRHHVTFEHILIENINDTSEDAKKLVALARRAKVPLRVNLIPYNQTLGNPFSKSAIARQKTFQKILEEAGIVTTIRKSMGDDIAAACGQLINKT